MSNPIGWCEETWVPYTGCDKVSPGCENCYALKMSWRLSHNPKTKAGYEGTVKKTAGDKLNWTGSIQENLSQADKPLRTKKPTMFFVNSMSDMFHEALSFDQIDQLFEIMSRCPQHVFQVLTKRAGHMYGYYKWKDGGNGFKFTGWPLKNVWLGVSVENQKYADERIPSLLSCDAEVRFLSCEPLLGAINLVSIKVSGEKRFVDCLTGILHSTMGEGILMTPTDKIVHQVIIGGESGHGARPMHPDWVRDIIRQCEESGTAIYFKQHGEFLEGIHNHNNYLVATDGATCRIKPSAEDMRGFDRNDGGVIVSKVGKHNAGNRIDGKQYLQLPRAK